MKPDNLRDRFLGPPKRRLQLLREPAHILVIDNGELNLRLITALLRRAGYAPGRPLEHARIEMIERLAGAAERRDDDMSRHTRRVGELSARIARVVGLQADDVQFMSRAAALHDVGKIGIPHALLRKPARLTEEEMRIMRTHTTIGAHILGGSVHPLLQLAEVIALSHHERWDGTGYPQRLAGEAIPLAGRIVSVADAFDALTNDRPYRCGCAIAEALDEIAAQRGTKFDADVVDALHAITVDGERQGAARSSSPASLSYKSIA